MLLRSLTALCLLLLATGPADLQSQPVAPNRDPSFVYTVAKLYEPLAWMRGEERFPKGAALFIKDGKSERPLLPDFVAAADPVVSFDAERVLFAGKVAPPNLWQIWEVSLQGGVHAGSLQALKIAFVPSTFPTIASSTRESFMGAL